MAEGGELMSQLLSENADLKKQVCLLKENQMLRRLLSQSCQDGGGRDLLPQRAPAYPEAGSPGSGVSKTKWFIPLLSSGEAPRLQARCGEVGEVSDLQVDWSAAVTEVPP
ncbi:hypothetical protein P7K49_032357 [Saguinus oedipus]|uniref:Speriolin N-terminal domain-containing protein n=1 Tax=Saguinus oedipus TaxID=9490 RepID=A0ABQ9TYP1_SAGOE|nr:hypothetical protein P7K49_032357 [Saguinus oedipus]